MAEVVAKEPADTKGDTTVAPTSADAAAVPASTAPSSTAGDSKNIPAKGKSIEAFEGENEEAGTHNGRRDTEKRSDGKRPARSRSASPNPDAKWAARERSPPRERQPIESYQGAGGGMASGATGSQAYGGSGDAAVEPPMANNGMGASSGAQICRDFTMGRCFRANCRFLHEGASAGGGAMGGQIMQPCKDWMNGKCYRGTRCRFSHEGDMMMQQQQQQQQYGAQNYFYGGAGGYGQYSQNGYYAGQYCPPVGYGGVGGYGAQAQAYNGGFGGGFGGGQRREKCRDYMYGKCSRGNMCKFMHEDAGVDMCKDFQNGKCQRGAECKFLHQSMDGSMGMSRYGGEAAGEQGSISSPVCKDWQNGKCIRGQMCRYLHSGEGGGATTTSTDAPRSEECRDFLLGRCFRGSTCRFLHPEGREGAGNAQSAVLEPCKDFMRGLCSRGTFCRYSHDVSRGQI